MANDPVDWKGSWTLDDYVISLFETRQTESSEFQVLIRVYGRERLVKIWESFQRRKKGIQPQPIDAVRRA